jgi:hypothetical protein
MYESNNFISILVFQSSCGVSILLIPPVSPEVIHISALQADPQTHMTEAVHFQAASQYRWINSLNRSKISILRNKKLYA